MPRCIVIFSFFFYSELTIVLFYFPLVCAPEKVHCGSMLLFLPTCGGSIFSDGYAQGSDTSIRIGWKKMRSGCHIGSLQKKHLKDQSYDAASPWAACWRCVFRTSAGIRSFSFSTLFSVYVKVSWFVLLKLSGRRKAATEFGERAAKAQEGTETSMLRLMTDD